jgi:hypothetical protein
MKFLVDVGVGKKVEPWQKIIGFDVLAVRDLDPRANDLQTCRHDQYALRHAGATLCGNI